MTTQLSSRPAWRQFAPSLVISLVAPFLVYLVAQSYVDSQTTAFAIGASIPVLWTLGRFAVQRKVDPIGVFSVVVFGLALLVTWLTGGSPLVLELRDAAPTGVLGLACLVSVLVRRPLIHAAMTFFGRWNPALAVRAQRTAATSTATTTIVGLVLVVHAAVLTAMALTMSVSAYLGLHQVVGYSILGVGVASAVWYRKRVTAASN